MQEEKLCSRTMKSLPHPPILYRGKRGMMLIYTITIEFSMTFRTDAGIRTGGPR